MERAAVGRRKRGAALAVRVADGEDGREVVYIGTGIG
jgi:hypothetical protein